MIVILCLGFLSDTTHTDTTDIVHYQGKSIVYDLENSLIILRDSSFITYQDISLFSDSAYYHVDSNYLEAFGEAFLKQLNDSIKGNYLKYNVETKKALMTDGHTQIDKGFIEGSEIYWVNEKVVNAYDGIYTTCNHVPAHYYFYSPRMKVYLGDMVIARPIVLYIEGIPVLAAPFWFVPIASRRKSGLMPFRAGNSRSFGKFIRGFSYYLVISDYADLTLQVDAMEKKGIMPTLEGVWDFTPFTKGTIYGSYIREIDTEIERYSIEARNNSEYFLFGSRFNCDIKYESDNSYHEDYAESTTLWLEKEIISQATLSRDLGEIRNNIMFERKEDFVDSLISEKMPYYTVTTPSHMLFSLINYSLTGHANRSRMVDQDSTSEVSGANIHTAPALQQNVQGLFTIAPSANLDLAVFDEDTAGNKWPTRFGYSFGATMSTNLFRVYNLEVLGFHGLLHKVLPKVTYTYTPNFSFGQFPMVSGIPSFSQAHNIGLGLDQNFEVKVGAKKDKRSILRTSVNTTYNLLNDSLTPLSFLVSLPYNPIPKPITAFTTQVTGSVNPYTRDYTYMITNTTALETDFFTIKVNQSYIKDGVYQIWFNGDAKPTPNWSISYGARYDWQEKRFVDYSVGLSRDLHCWQAVFNLRQLGDDWAYDFKVMIKEIPEVQIGKGLFGYVLE